MTVAIDITPMDIDHDTFSSTRSEPGKSDTAKSEVTQASSFDEYGLPNSPTKKEHTHISPFAKYLELEHEGVFKLQEAVATTLFNASPDASMSFVDPVVGTFKAIFKGEKQLVVWRKGNAGFIGIFEHHTSMKAFGFEHLVGFSIGYDGSWRIIKGAGNAFCSPKWPEVWLGKFEGYGGIHRMVVDDNGMEEEKAERAAKLGVRMLESKFWEATADVKAA